MSRRRRLEALEGRFPSDLEAEEEVRLFRELWSDPVRAPRAADLIARALDLMAEGQAPPPWIGHEILTLLYNDSEDR